MTNLHELLDDESIDPCTIGEHCNCCRLDSKCCWCGAEVPPEMV